MTGSGYIAEVYAGDAAVTVHLGRFVAPTRRLALRWLRGQAHRFARALDPDPCDGWVSPRALRLVTHAEWDASSKLRHWADGERRQDQAARRLAAGRAYLFLTRDETCSYALSARPAYF
ncbi:hypothetical protein OG782_22200 [Streptomyces sp. NBC_00876]|uniref:hypothetical protein n=1 Tax=Streptomyces sp. NBC_00876 TaxID=2975853 RepID=UPI00386F0B5F|nr:hypothetical protein OG782_22200 [Streptomyces sp. NBC_00876]